MKKVNHMTKLSLVLCLILSISMLFASCAAKSDAYLDREANDAMSPMDPSMDYGYVSDSYYSSATKGEIYDAPTLEAAPEPVAPNAPAEAPSAAPDAAQMSEKIIRNVSIDAQTKEYDKAVDEIRAAVSLIGGFEETFRSTGKSYYQNGVYSRSAFMVLRLPASELDTFLNQVGGMVNVLSQNSNAQNVTGEYYDIKSRLSVLESERAAYEEMLKQSMEIKELLEIKDRLYNVIAEIESYQTRLNLLDSKVSYSTVTISLAEVVEYTPVITEEPTFGERAAEAFRESWKSFAEGCQNFAIWFVYAVPTILILAAIAAVVIVVVVKLNRKHRRQAPKKDEADTTPSDK